MQESIVFLLRVQCRRKEISRSLSHLLMSFLFSFTFVVVLNDVNELFAVYFVWLMLNKKEEYNNHLFCFLMRPHFRLV